MRRTVFVIPDLFGATPEDSPLVQKLETLRSMTELGELKRLNPLPPLETPEAIWLGMKPEEGQLRQGPLTVSAFGFDPPERSTHFHVSLLGYNDGNIIATPGQVSDEDLRLIQEQAKKLNTKTLTFLNGEDTDHALVWESFGDMQTNAASQVVGKEMKPFLPQGDGDRELRRFIDDSINILTSLELNERRIDEGIPPLNLLWPWGHGVRKPVPNLLLKRGERVHVESNSLRLAGLTRLVGYRHGNRQSFGAAINTRLKHLAEIALSDDLSIILLDAPQQLREKGMLEELHWFVNELDTQLLKPLFQNGLKNPARLAVIGTGPQGGLSLNFETKMNSANIYPFDERTIEEKSVPKSNAWQEIERAIIPPR
jgi:2,3-bisphosphoglycerate-independent phosphoglycerate mutase